jgi:hypothetical protein
MGEDDSRSQSQTHLEMFNANTAGMVTRRLNLTRPTLITPPTSSGVDFLATKGHRDLKEILYAPFVISCGQPI